jgi:antitoxin MazE
MTKTLKLVRIGNSKGIRIPHALIERYHLDGEVNVTETAAGLLLQSADSKKLSLEDSFAAMARDGRSKAEAEPWSATLADGLEDENFKGWPR